MFVLNHYVIGNYTKIKKKSFLQKKIFKKIIRGKFSRIKNQTNNIFFFDKKAANHGEYDQLRKIHEGLSSHLRHWKQRKSSTRK